MFNLIKRSKRLSEDEAFGVFIQAANAVYFLHNNDYIHRDIKPENLLLTDYKEVKLCDFGWCAEIMKGERATFCGTYEYMAPEIIKDIPYTKEIDAWSLGVLLYEMLHGYSPFRDKSNKSENYNEIFKNIIKFNFRIERELSPECIEMITSFIIRKSS